MLHSICLATTSTCRKRLETIVIFFCLLFMESRFFFLSMDMIGSKSSSYASLFISDKKILEPLIRVQICAVLIELSRRHHELFA